MCQVAFNGAAEALMLEQEFDFIKAVKLEFDKQNFMSNDRNIIYEPLFDISFGHCVSVLILIKEKLYSSSEALAHPIIESFLRAVWVKHCVQDTKLTKLRETGKFPGLSKLLEEIENSVPHYKSTKCLTE